jgi:hypothetical protein
MTGAAKFSWHAAADCLFHSRHAPLKSYLTSSVLGGAGRSRCSLSSKRRLIWFISPINFMIFLNRRLLAKRHPMGIIFHRRVISLGATG